MVSKMRTQRVAGCTLKVYCAAFVVAKNDGKSAEEIRKIATEAREKHLDCTVGSGKLLY